MGDLSKHFSLSELVCHCGCGSVIVHDEQIQILEAAREHFGASIKIMSGTRCAKHNKAVGGAPKSQHLYGIAVDIQVEGVAPSLVADYFEKLFPDKYGIGRYRTFTHFDIRPNKARWDMTGG